MSVVDVSATVSGDSAPKAASTLVILRESKQGPNVLLTVRSDDMRFLAGATVFPGGAVAPEDGDLLWERASEISADEASLAIDQDPAAALGTFICAMREAFEEVGFIAGSGGIDRVDRQSNSPQAFLEQCLKENVTLATDQLVPIGKFVTPLGRPLRFDMHVFVTSAPPAWEPSVVSSEVASWRWVTPAEALKDLEAGNALMATPTVEILQLLDGHANVDDVIRSALTRRGRISRSVTSMRLSPLVRLVIAPNPSLMTGPGTNTYVVGMDDVLVIDPAVSDPEYLDALLEGVNKVSAILVTHRHPDHVGGVRSLASRTGAQVHAWGTAAAGGVPVEPIRDRRRIVVGGVTLIALHTPGHASDHLSFLLGETSLFSGDVILGDGTSLIAPPDGDMDAYMDTLHRLHDLDIDRIYPGHFRTLLRGRRVIRRYISHRQERESAILAALAGGPKTNEQIVESVYTDTARVLHPYALLSVQAHLESLYRRGAVTSRGRRWSLCDG